MSIIGHSILGHKVYAPEGRPGPFSFICLPPRYEIMEGGIRSGLGVSRTWASASSVNADNGHLHGCWIK